jgi:hypothetical protein
MYICRDRVHLSSAGCASGGAFSCCELHITSNIFTNMRAALACSFSIQIAAAHLSRELFVQQTCQEWLKEMLSALMADMLSHL